MALVDVKEYDAKVQFEIGQRIQNLRMSKGIAGIDLAAYLDIGKNQLSRIENGRANCTIQQIYILAQVLGCSADYLLFGNGSMTFSQEQVDSIKNLVAVFENSL